MNLIIERLNLIKNILSFCLDQVGWKLYIFRVLDFSFKVFSSRTLPAYKS